jgi:DNA-binding transcriptional MerR regulator
VKKVSARAAHIPEKKYFRIGEVSKIVGVDTHVLRYWETEFPRIRPRRAKSRQRLYRKQDVECLLLVKELLHEQGYTISGARKVLKERLARGAAGCVHSGGGSGRVGVAGSGRHLSYIKKELQKILEQVADRQP